MGRGGSPTRAGGVEDGGVPEANVRWGRGDGVAVARAVIGYERLVRAAEPIGIMQAGRDLARPYVHERKQFDQPIGEFQLMQGKLADMYTAMNAAKAYVYAVARACDRGGTTRKDAAGAILFASEKATWMEIGRASCRERGCQYV